MQIPEQVFAFAEAVGFICEDEHSKHSVILYVSVMHANTAMRNVNMWFEVRILNIGYYKYNMVYN